jgi:general secretion pathway protein J
MSSLRARVRRRRRAAVSGFTLVEVLMATALMATILAALGTVTAQWLPNWNRGFARVQRTEHLAVGLERLVADLAAAEFIPAGGRDLRAPTFDGGELSVTFVRTALGPNARPGLELVRIAEVGGDRGPTLVRTRAPFVPVTEGVNDRVAPSFSDAVVLMRPPYRVSFAYAGADRQWHNTWRGGYDLPRAIRITLRDAASQRTLSVSTATRVHVDVPPDCVTAKSVLDCRRLRAPEGAESAEGAARNPREL